MRLVARDEQIEGRPVLALDGDIDLGTLPLVRDHLARHVSSHPGAVVAVDIESVGTLDDSGLGAFLGAAGKARQAGGDLILLCANARLRERFAVTRLDLAIEIHPRPAS